MTFRKTMMVFAAISCAWTFAQAEEPFNGVEKAEINKLIRDYILANPEILPEAFAVLQERQVARLMKTYNDEIYNDGLSHVGGNPKGDVTIVEFYDYNCGYCKKSLSTLQRILKNDPGVRLIYKELPVLAASSAIAARASLAAEKQGKFEKFHAALLNNRQPLNEDRILAVARAAGLDDKKLSSDMNNPLFEQNLAMNRFLAEKFQINGTPGFIIGNVIIPGALPYEDLMAAVKKARSQIK